MQAGFNCRTIGAVASACVALLLGACEVQTYSDAASAFNNGTSPPPEIPPPGGTGGGGGSGASFGPNFSEIQSNVLTPSCATAGCHAGGAPAAGLNLDSNNSYTMLVGVPSTQEAGVLRVAAGNPANSYLLQKLEGTAATGGAMPPSGALPAASIDVIRQWILDGATDDRAAPPAAPIRVTSLSPGPNAALATAPTQIVAGFDRALDASTVNAMTFTVRGAGGDASFTDGNEVAVTATSITVPASNPMTAIFDLGGSTLADDTYRVSLAGAGASIIQDIDANALDGEFSGSFPSGNGVAGGNFVTQFSVSTPVQPVPTLADIQANVFTPRCASCHTGVGANLPGALDLTSAALSYQSLVGVTSTQDPALQRVEAGAPNASYLIYKLENTNGVGVMPPTGMLPQATIDNIRQWIADGAAP